MLRKLIFCLVICNTSIFCQKNRSDSLIVKKHLQEGDRLNETQEYEKAIISYLNAIEVLEKSKDSSKIASVYTNIGVVNSRLKNFDQATLYLEKANKLTTKNDTAKLRITYNLSGFYYDNKDFTSFLSSIKKAENLALNLQNNRILSAIYSTYCNYYRDIKNYKTSINYGLKSYDLKKKLGLNPDITINNIGYSYLLGGNYAKAIEYLSKITITPNRQLRVYVFNNLKNAYEKLHQKDKALLYANQYITLNDSLVKAQEKVKVASLIEKYEASKKQQQITNLKTENRLKEIKLRSQKNWFLGLGIFGILSALSIFLWLKNKKNQQDLEKASIQHKLLRSQLNPHFLFHSLNSIQSYIYQNKKEASANYLANYSKLIRTIFDSSDKDFITIKEDKISIENYLALQKLNFNEKIDLSLTLDDTISDYKIPPMFVQPFVENAFLHGINAVENGKISVKYKEENENIKICIADNGNGFKKSKNNNTLSKVSSSEVIQKRVDNLRKTHGFNISIDTKSSENGTVVTLLFPKKNNNMKYAIIEDEQHTVTMTQSIVSDAFSDLVFCGTASNIKDGIKLLKNEKPAIVFLDVHLDDGESFKILQEFPTPNFKLIFVTSYSKFAIEAFKFSAIDFVLKPFTTNDIVTAVEKVLANNRVHEYQEKLTTFFHNYTSSQQKIVLSNADSVHIVSLEDIWFAKSDNNYTTFYVNDGREILISKPLKHFEEKLSNSFFFRTHQKYLINLHQITQYDKRKEVVMLTNGSSIPVSQSKKISLLHLLSV